MPSLETSFFENCALAAMRQERFGFPFCIVMSAIERVSQEPPQLILPSGERGRAAES